MKSVNLLAATAIAASAMALTAGAHAATIAGLYNTGRLSPRHENGVWYFQNLVREALAA